MPDKAEKIERDIAALKKQQHIRYALFFMLFFLAIGFISDLITSVFLDKHLLMDFLKTYRWGKLLWMGAILFGIGLLIRRWSQKELRKKQAELMRLHNSSI